MHCHSPCLLADVLFFLQSDAEFDDYVSHAGLPPHLVTRLRQARAKDAGTDVKAETEKPQLTGVPKKVDIKKLNPNLKHTPNLADIKHEKEKFVAHKAKGIPDTESVLRDKVIADHYEKRKPSSDAQQKNGPILKDSKPSYRDLAKDAVDQMHKRPSHDKPAPKTKKVKHDQQEPIDIKLSKHTSHLKHRPTNPYIVDDKPFELPGTEEEHVHIAHTLGGAKASVNIQAHGKEFSINLQKSSRDVSDIALVMLGLPLEEQQSIQSKLEVSDHLGITIYYY